MTKIRGSLEDFMNIGFVAHDAKKILMQNFCIAYRGIICKHNLYATASTGRLIEEATGRKRRGEGAGDCRKTGTDDEK